MGGGGGENNIEDWFLKEIFQWKKSSITLSRRQSVLDRSQSWGIFLETSISHYIFIRRKKEMKLSIYQS